MPESTELTYRFMEPAFTTEQVMRITGASRRRINYWLGRGIVSAETDVLRGRRHVRVWSFRNLIEVRVALWLREKVSLQLLGKIVIKLRSQGLVAPLAEVRVGIVDRRQGTSVVVQGADGNWQEPISGQLVMELTLPMAQFKQELDEAIDLDRSARRVPGHIERQRGRLGSAPVFAGTRIPVDVVRRLQSAGWDDASILEEYPALTGADIEAAGMRAG